jgi:hypothetical protein
MKAFLATWPLISTMLLSLFLFIRFLLGELPTLAMDTSIIDLLIIPIGHFVAFFLIGSVILNELKNTSLITKELSIGLITMAIFTAALQLFWRGVNNGLASINCADNCADTLYAAPGLPMATIATWLVVLSALTYFTAKVIFYENRPIRKV